MMGIDDIRIKQNVGIIGQLGSIVILQAEIRIQLMVGHLLLYAEAGLGTVEDKARLGKSLITLRVDANAIHVVTHFPTTFRVEIHLSAETRFLQGLDAQLAAKMARVRMVVAQKGAILRGNRVVEKTIPVAIHFHEVVPHVAQQQQTVAFTDIDPGVEVEFRHGHGIDKAVDEYLLRMIILGFLEIDVDLSTDGLIAVSNGGRAFGDRNAMHPSARHIAQTERRGKTTEVGHVLSHHLGIETTEAEQLDLFGTRDGIGISHIHRSIGLKALCEAATGATTQGLAGDMLNMKRIEGVDVLCLLTGCHLYFVQGDGAAHDMVVMLRFSHVVYRVVLITHEAKHQTFVSRVKLNIVMAMFVGDSADIGDFPINVDSRKGLSFSIYLFVNGAFDDVLGEGVSGESQYKYNDK